MIIHGIHSQAMYNTRDLKLIGIGDVELMRARQAGVVPRKIGRWHWYWGAELIAWMRDKDCSATNGDGETFSPAGTDSGHEAHFSERTEDVGAGTEAERAGVAVSGRSRD